MDCSVGRHGSTVEPLHFSAARIPIGLISGAIHHHIENAGLLGSSPAQYGFVKVSLHREALTV